MVEGTKERPMKEVEVQSLERLGYPCPGKQEELSLLELSRWQSVNNNQEQADLGMDNGNKILLNQIGL